MLLCIYVDMRVYIHIYIYRIHTYIHTYVRTYIHTYIHTHIIAQRGHTWTHQARQSPGPWMKRAEEGARVTHGPQTAILPLEARRQGVEASDSQGDMHTCVQMCIYIYICTHFCICVYPKTLYVQIRTYTYCCILCANVYTTIYS